MAKENYFGRTDEEIRTLRNKDRNERRERRHLLVKIGIGSMAIACLAFGISAAVGYGLADSDPSCTITVGEGDTLAKITEESGTSPKEIEDLNPDTDLTELKPGDTLNLSDCGNLEQD